ncbi:hypothetical protein PZH32_12830, partial [Adlercreutzia equolifaciens]|nr:hypothetical protein [Adlercreutzia equolifaciens]
AMRRAAPLVPSMRIACDREAWAVRGALLPDGEFEGEVDGLADALFDPELRLTFDDRLENWDCFRPQAGWCPIIAPQESILEIKSAGPYPRWLVTALSAHA